MVKTYFAPAERSVPEHLDLQIKTVCGHPMLDGLLHLVGGCIAVLNVYRQIVAVNETLLNMMGFDNVHRVLGLRLGEALKCSHASDMPGGCGTGQACASCGAAIAMVSSMGAKKTVEKTCSVSTDRSGQIEDLYFRVTASPLFLKDESYILLFLQDISRRQQHVDIWILIFDISYPGLYYHPSCFIVFGELSGQRACCFDKQRMRK